MLQAAEEVMWRLCSLPVAVLGEPERLDAELGHVCSWDALLFGLHERVVSADHQLPLPSLSRAWA